jgi:hypothetical protein
MRRPWFAFPEDLPDDPALDALGDAALGALVRLWAASSRLRLDGFIGAAAATRLVPDPVLVALEKNGVILRAGSDGFLLRGFDEVNLSASQRGALQERARAAAVARWNLKKSSGNADASSIAGSIADRNAPLPYIESISLEGKGALPVAMRQALPPPAESELVRLLRDDVGLQDAAAKRFAESTTLCRVAGLLESAKGRGLLDVERRRYVIGALQRDAEAVAKSRHAEPTPNTTAPERAL